MLVLIYRSGINVSGGIVVALSDKVMVKVKRYFVRRERRETIVIRDVGNVLFAPKEETFTLVSYISEPKNGNQNEIHRNSFIGRALLSREVSEEVEVNVGGLSISEIAHEAISGNIFIFEILSVEAVQQNNK